MILDQDGMSVPGVVEVWTESAWTFLTYRNPAGRSFPLALNVDNNGFVTVASLPNGYWAQSDCSGDLHYVYQAGTKWFYRASVLPNGTGYIVSDPTPTQLYYKFGGQCTQYNYINAGKLETFAVADLGVTFKPPLRIVGK